MKIILHGHIGTKFGKEWDLSVKSPNEGLRAIDANTGGFFSYLGSKENENLYFRIYRDKTAVGNHEELGLESSNTNTVHFFPIIKGSSERSREANRMMGYGALGMGLSWGLDYLGAQIGGTFGKILGWVADIGYEISASMMMQGAMMHLTKDPPDPPNHEDAQIASKSTTSYTFSRPLNNTTQGAVVPVGYGRLRIGSHVISSHLMNSRLVAFNQVRNSTEDDDGNLVGAVNVDHYTL